MAKGVEPVIVAMMNEAVSGRRALPCRISGYRQGDTFKLASMRPTAMLGVFRNQEVGPVAKEVETVIVAMMNEAV